MNIYENTHIYILPFSYHNPGYLFLIPRWGFILNVTANNLIPQWKDPKRFSLISGWLWILYLTYCILLFLFLLTLGDVFFRRAVKRWFAIIHIVVLLNSMNPNVFCSIPRLQKLPYNALPLASIAIVMLLVYCPPPSFLLVVLPRLANVPSVTHDSLTFFFADCLPKTLYKLVLF